MSYLNLPRLSFMGTAYANASTATNNDIANVINVDTLTINPSIGLIDGGTAVDPAVSVFQWTGVKDNPSLRNWLMGFVKIPTNIEDGIAQQAHWNYYGDHETRFDAASVIQSLLSTNAPAPQSDPLLGAQVELLGDVFYQERRGGVLVDVDPYALVTSQIFAGQLLVSIQQNGKKVPLIQGNRPTRAFAYYINPNKNVNSSCVGFEGVSAVFEFSVAKENLVFNDAIASPALADLKARALAGLGLNVRFCFYNAVFKIHADAMHAAFTANPPNYQSNPYLGIVLGTVGVWNAGEMATVPPGRKLRLQTKFPFTPPSKSLSPEKHRLKQLGGASLATYRSRVPAPAAAGAPSMARLGITPAVVDPTRSVVTLDLVCTFPEADPNTLQKLDLGEVDLMLLNGANPPLLIGQIPNDKATYQNGSGVVDISYAGNANKAQIDSQIATGQLAIYQKNSGTYLLKEDLALEIASDDRAVYFDLKVGEGSSAAWGTSSITIQVYRQGAAPLEDVTINLEYWMCAKNLVNPDKPQVNVPANQPYFTIADTTRIGPTTYPDPMNPNGTIGVVTDQIKVPAGGKLTLRLTAQNPGVSMVRFVDPALQTPIAPNFAWDNIDYAVVRILPFDDYSQIPDAQINTWDFMYANFFSYFTLLYPVMSQIIPWGPDNAPNNPEDVKTFASELLVFTDPALWNTSIYMPITRELSAGKRNLLRRWCNLNQ